MGESHTEGKRKRGNQEQHVKKTAIMFRQMFLGLSYEQAFLNGLNVDELAENFRHIYSLLKAWYSFVFLTSIIFEQMFK